MRTSTSMALIILLSGAAASALGQSAQMPGTAGSAGPIQSPGAILPDGGWQPLFEGTRDPDADLIFEVPVTFDSIPRAIRIGGTGPLMTPDQLIVTCVALPAMERLESATFGGGIPDLPELGSAPGASATADPDLEMLRLLSGTTSLPLERIEPGVEHVVNVSVTLDERLPFGVDNWVCGMALWRDSEADACPIGSCALPNVAGLNETPGPSYEPQPGNGSLLATEGSVPAIP